MISDYSNLLTLFCWHETLTNVSDGVFIAVLHVALLPNSIDAHYKSVNLLVNAEANVLTISSSTITSGIIASVCIEKETVRESSPEIVYIQQICILTQTQLEQKMRS